MLGNPMRIEFDGFGVNLRPTTKDDLPNITEYMQHMQTVMYTNSTFAKSIEDEEEWFKRICKDPQGVNWAIVPDGSDVVVGITALHDIHPLWGSCISGIIIGDSKWWGKGVAYRAHLARTWYAVNVLNRLTIQSMVRAPNTASFRALQKVGYRISGKWDANGYRMNKYLDTYMMSWVNPYKAHILYPDGIPNELSDSLKKAKEALEFADKVVRFV